MTAKTGQTDGDTRPQLHRRRLRTRITAADRGERRARLREGSFHRREGPGFLAPGGSAEATVWLNFRNVDGLSNPVPGTFVGGINVMPAGSTGYFTVDLEPGRHLLVAQYTGVMGVHTAFTVAPAT